MEVKKVYLLYEGDEWLSNQSLVLMGIFTSIAKLKDAARELITQRADEHLTTAIENFDFCEDSTEEDVVDDILTELFNNRSTQGWLVNYSFQEVELNKLEEI